MHAPHLAGRRVHASAECDTVRPMTHRPLPALLAALMIACGAEPPPPPAPAVPSAQVAVVATDPEVADVPPPVLRTGSLEPEDLGSVTATSVERFDDGDFAVLSVTFPRPPGLEAEWSMHRWAVLGAESAPLSFVARGTDRALVLWVRRSRGDVGPVRARIGVPGERGAGRIFEVVAPAPPPAQGRSAALREAYASDLQSHLDFVFATTWIGGDVGRRARRALVGAPPRATARAVDGERRLSSHELAELMRMTTGVGALRAALAHDRSLPSGSADKPTIPVASLTPPELPTHPWADMARALDKTPVEEPLARLAPADAWFVRAGSLGALFRALDESERWVTPAVRMVESLALESAIARRYETQLGLGRSALARAFGDSVVGQVALVGGDPYLREGSDLSVLFQVRSRGLFEAALTAAMGEHASAHGDRTFASKLTHEGVEIRVMESDDGSIRQHRATLSLAGVGDVEVVSNSAGAVRRIIDVAQARRPALASEADIRYALARDGERPADVIALVGEAFVRKIVGPAHKIAEARRQLSRSELLAPGVAAVTFGWQMGRAPASTDELVRGRWLEAAELTHADGAPIRFAPGQAPTSRWGRPAFMTPLVDLSPVERVTPSERGAYTAFQRSYEQGWGGEPFDPIAIRLSLPERGPLTAHVRVLPIPRDSDIDELRGVVGDTRIVAERDTRGARFVVGLSGAERWRRELGFDLGRLIGQERTLEWVGRWAAVGVADKNGLLHALRRSLPVEVPPEARSRSVTAELAAFTKLPLWIGVDVQSPATLGILLTVLRKLADDAVPGMVHWGEIGKEGEVPVVGVRVRGEAVDRSLEDDEVAIFYAIAPGVPGGGSAIYLSFDEAVLRSLVRDHVAGKGPRTVEPAAGDPRAAQALVEATAAADGALATALSWIAEAAARGESEQSRRLAEWFLRSGVPQAEVDALARAYLGASPVTPSGRTYVVGPHGVADPERGNPLVPTFPALPVRGTAAQRVAEHIGRVRISTAFDEEPASTKARPLTSFQATIEVDAR